MSLPPFSAISGTQGDLLFSFSFYFLSSSALASTHSINGRPLAVETNKCTEQKNCRIFFFIPPSRRPVIFHKLQSRILELLFLLLLLLSTLSILVVMAAVLVREMNFGPGVDKSGNRKIASLS